MISHSVEIEGTVIRWEEEGDGISVVLIHGIPTCPALWRRVAPLIQGARLLAFEMVGYGDSIPEGRNKDISVGRQADYLAAWLKHIGIPQAVLVGHDLGGGVAHIAAVRHQELCAGLLLTNAVGYDSWPIPSVKAMRAAAPLTRRMPAPVLKQMLRMLLYRGHDNRSMARDSLEVHWRPYAQHGGARALARQVQSLDVRDTLSVAGSLRGLDVPATVVWGAADQFQKVRYGERFAKDLRAQLRLIEGGRHFTPEDHPEIIAEEINELLGRL